MKFFSPRAVSRFTTATLSAVVLSFGVASAAGATPPDGTRVIYSHSTTVAAPPVTGFAGGSGGDGWNLSATATRIYNVFHHSAALRVDCHVKATAKSCAGFPVTVTDAGANFVTGMDPALTVDPATDKGYVFVGKPTRGQGGVACIDLATPATPFCGYTVLTSTVSWSPFFGITNAVQVGTKLYAFNGFTGDFSGSRNHILCFDMATAAACAGQPYAVGSTLTQVRAADHSFGTLSLIGNVIPFTLYDGANGGLSCFDTVSLGNCTGNWPRALPAGSTTVRDALLAPLIPVLDSSGAFAGVCVTKPVTPTCVDAAGASLATPTGLGAAMGSAQIWDYLSPAVIRGSKIFMVNSEFLVSYSSGNHVNCYDYATNAACPNYPYTPPGSLLLYTVNADQTDANCLWINSDSGSGQIQNLDPATTKPCGSTSGHSLALTALVSPAQECAPTGYISLTVTSPPPSAYTNGTVSFLDGAGAVVAGPVAIPQDGIVPVESLALETKGFTTASVHLPGAEQQPAHVSMDWYGDFHAGCQSLGQTAVFASAAPTVTAVEKPSGPEKGNYTVTIRGTGFHPNANVSLGVETCSNVVVASSTEITCTVPPGHAGPVDVTVINPDSQLATLAKGFTYEKTALATTGVDVQDYLWVALSSVVLGFGLTRRRSLRSPR